MPQAPSATDTPEAPEAPGNTGNPPTDNPGAFGNGGGMAGAGTATTFGYEPPRNRQFSVFLDNRVGRLLELLEAIEAPNLTLAGLSVLDSTNHAVVRVLTSNSDLARRLLQRKQLAFAETEVLAVELEREHNFARLCTCLLAAELNIHYCYPLLTRPRGVSAVVLYSDDPTLSGQILHKKGFTLLAENDMGDNAPGTAPRINGDR